MSKLPAVSGRNAVKALKAFGFYEARQNGSHLILKKDGHPFVVTVPMHGNEDLKKGTLRGIIDSAGLSVDEFVSQL